MSDVLGTLCSKPITKDERKILLDQSKVLGIYNKAIVIFDKKAEQFWAVLDDKQIQLVKSDLSKLGISTKGCK